MFNAAFFVLLPEIKTGLSLTNTQIGTLSTIRAIISGLANIPAGFIGDQYPKRRAVILGGSIILVSVFAFALGMATNFWTAVMFCSLLSVAITFWHPAAISSLAKEFTSKRGFAIALHGTGGSIGETLGPVIAGSLIGVIGWRLVLQGSIIPGVFCGVLIWMLLKNIPVHTSQNTTIVEYISSVIKLLRNRRLLLVLIFAAGFAGAQSTMLTFLPIYLDENKGFQSVTIGLYLSLAQVGGILSQPMMGYVSDKLGRKIVLAPSMLILGLSCLGIPIASNEIMFGLVMLVMGAFTFPLMALFLASAMDLVETGTQATTVSLVFGAAIVVSAFVPAVAGIIADTVNIESAFVLAASLALLTAMLTLVTKWQSQE
jgi:predicted MFS family arabinose efflux permease